MERSMETLVNKDIKVIFSIGIEFDFCSLFFQFKLSLSDDGSGKGAAMVACVAERNLFIQPDKETNDYENVDKSLLN